MPQPSKHIPEPTPMNDRGFVRSTFHDRYGVECSIQDSSLATEAAIWLGQQHCEKPDCDSPTRMHLTQEMVAELLPLLQRFVETGSIGGSTATDTSSDAVTTEKG